MHFLKIIPDVTRAAGRLTQDNNYQTIHRNNHVINQAPFHVSKLNEKLHF